MKFFHSLFIKLLLCLLLISVIPLRAVGWVTYQHASKNMTDNLNFHANYILEQKMKALNILYDDLQRMSSRINNSKLFSTFSENKNLLKHQRLYPDLDRIISIVNVLPEIEGITIINEQGFIYYYGYSFNRNVTATDIFDKHWFQSIKDFSNPQISKLHTREYSNFDKDKNVYSYIHKAWDNKLQTYSFIIIDFDSDLIADLLNENVEIKTSTGTFIYGFEDFILPPHSSLGISYQFVKKHTSGSTLINDEGKKYLIFKQSHPITNWTLVEYFEVDSFYMQVSNTKYITFYTIIISIFICLFASLFVSHRMSRPINRLQKKMIEVENGDFKQRFITNSKDEIGDLARGFNHMLIKIKQLIDSVAKEEKLKKEAEITALQLQINPHFIYNTLETINSLARKKKDHEISHLIVLLGRLLRLSISSFEEKVTVNQEITYIEYYLMIQKVRMREPLEFRISIDPSIGNCLTVKWILQPIVENAIIHGIDALQTGGMISVEGISKDDHIIFTVTDNGPGINPSSLEQICQRLKYKSANLTKYKKRVGLYNVQTRIISHYGDCFGISIESTLNKGTSVTIKIPKVEGDEE